MSVRISYGVAGIAGVSDYFTEPVTQASFPVGGAFNARRNTAYAISRNDGIAITVVLPTLADDPTLELGNTVRVKNLTGSFSIDDGYVDVSDITIDPGASQIDYTDGTMDLNTRNATVELMWFGQDTGWIAISR